MYTYIYIHICTHIHTLFCGCLIPPRLAGHTYEDSAHAEAIGLALEPLGHWLGIGAIGLGAVCTGIIGG